VDERLTSFEAKGEVMSRGGSRDYKNNPVDAIAARLILEGWLENNTH
jgi:putative Holliday junction resolvase